MSPSPVLTLSIESSGEVRAASSSGAEGSGEVNLDRLHNEMIELFDRWVRDKRLRQRGEFELFGSLLWRCLMPPGVERLLDRELSQVAEAGDRLRVQLQFQQPAAELARLPWEYTHRPSTNARGGLFLATAKELVLSRYLPAETPLRVLAPEDPPLRVLVVSSRPSDLGPVITEAPIAAINRLADTLPVTIRELETPTLDGLFDAVSDESPHIVHFMGHGRFVPERGEGEIALLDEDGSAMWLDDRRFAELLGHERQLPRLVFLHLCEGGAADYKADFAGMAPQLLRHDVQAVVAMQYPITNRTAVTFSTGFYERIARGAPVDHAVQEGRMRLMLAGRNDTDQLRDFGAPVLYMRSRTGLLAPAEPAEDAEP